jgi:hypothetical protein
MVREAIPDPGIPQEKFVIIFIAFLLDCDKTYKQQQATQKQMDCRIVGKPKSKHDIN